jgi:hypothetical protein
MIIIEVIWIIQIFTVVALLLLNKFKGKEKIGMIAITIVSILSFLLIKLI